MWRRWLAILSIAGLIIAGLWWIETSYAPLNGHYENNQTSQSDNEHNPSDDLLRMLGIVFGSIVNAIEAHHDLWLVLETLALVAFTGTLWWSTRRLWQTSTEHGKHIERSSRAALSGARAALAQAKLAESAARHIERPYLFATNPMGGYLYEPRNALAAMIAGGQHTDITDMTYNHLHFELGFRNYGRTPAVLEEINIAIAIAEVSAEGIIGVPIAPKYEEINSRKIYEVIGDNDTSRSYGSNLYHPDVRELAKELSQKKWCVVFGYVRYGDVSGRSYQRGFAYSFYNSELHHYSEQYNYDRELTAGPA